MAKRIVIATIGSLGDLHPCLALAMELGQRGRRVTIATTEFYRRNVEALGIAFHPMRPDWDPTDRELIAQCEDLKRGPEVLYRQMILPHLRDTYADLAAVTAGADLLIAGELVYAAPLVSEKLGVRWVSEILSPFSFFSAHDPSVLPNAPGMMHLRKAGWRPYRAALNLGRLGVRHWSNPVRELRRDLGLRSQCDPVFKDKFSPGLVLALFSQWLAKPAPDWPAQTVQPGFVFFDQQSAGGLPQELNQFLAAGDAPIVFTQGSTAVHNPGSFYEVSLEATRRLGRRAVLLGTDTVPGGGAEGVIALRYAPYARIFPRAAVIVHQGGSGTTGEAMRAGRPMLFVPYGWDQPDNAARISKLGVGLALPRDRYSPATAAAALQRLLDEARFRTTAAEVGARVRAEDGLAGACDAIEGVLAL